MSAKTCEYCGKVFFSKARVKKYCSKDCSREMAKKREAENGQPCWICKNACGGCSWSKHFLPVVGWDAEIHIVKDKLGDFQSYKIRQCPEFVRG